MFDKISDAAEKLASKVSRRHFFGSLGRWAGAAALGVAGLLVWGKEAQAGNGTLCCAYGCRDYNGGYSFQSCGWSTCPTSFPTGTGGTCWLLSVRRVPNCGHCPTGRA